MLGLPYSVCHNKKEDFYTMANNGKHTILYGRLSQEDDREGESNSIQNQRLILTKYAEEKGFDNIRFLFDDGFSGTNFNRPSWNEIMDLIESEQVETLIVKDMSRLGRDYLQTGFLMEHTFPNHNVRFIAINDAVDTLYRRTKNLAGTHSQG
jgi:DNA invertase Pin-like site-specific DNA recombinase